MSLRYKILFVFTFLLLLPSANSWAGLAELGVSANYRTSKINEDNYQESISYTGSISYYFWEMSALELSYTQGISKLSVKADPNEPALVYKTEFRLIGLDLVFTMAGRESTFQPFVKIGGAHITKKMVREAGSGGSQGASEIDSVDGVVPSAGVGFKVLLSKSFAIKAGVDAWTSPMSDKDDDKDLTIDYAGRVGVSWMF